MNIMIHEYVNEIYTLLGPGFSERVYHNALEIILRERGISYETERIIPIVFNGHTIGNLRADIIIEKTTVVELKSVKTITDAMVSQARNYLKLLNLTEAYLVNFPPTQSAEPEVIRVTLNSSV
jgi:GxxExxY protein